MSNYDGKIEPLPRYSNQGNEHYLSSDKPDTYLRLAEENTKQVKKIEPIIYKDDGEMLVGSKTLQCSFNDVNAKLTIISPSLKEQWCVREYEANAQPDYSEMYFIFNFKDGKQAKYRMDKDCNTMQAFLDRVGKYHETEERLAEASKTIERLQKRLKIAVKALKEAHKFPQTMSLKQWCEYRLKEIDLVGTSTKGE